MWYHAAEGAQEGPFDEQAFTALVRRGRIGADTLVWREGMADWAPYGSLATDSAIGATEAQPGTLCKQDLATSEMRCEDDGAMPDTMRTAGFMIRLGAVMIDGVILATLYSVLVAAGVFELPEGDTINRSQHIFSIVGVFYEILMVGKYGATIGKMATGLRVVEYNGRPVTMGRSTGRYFAKILSGLPTLTIGYLMAAFDVENRALHDRICSTRVVLK
jgi:uncharacterized RDD family membrane protein YckC